VPLVAVILFLALYPQFALHRSEGSVNTAVAAASRTASPAASPIAGISRQPFGAPGCHQTGRVVDCPTAFKVP
jgi:hypothetical protein